MKYMVPAWGVVLLVLYGILATVALFAGGFYTVQAKVETMRARAHSVRAELLMADMVRRFDGCVAR